MTEDSTIGGEFNNCLTLLRKFLRLSAQWHDSDDNSIAFARFVCHYLYSNAMQTRHPSFKVVTPVASTFPRPRQVIICSLILPTFTEDDSYHAYNSFLLKVTKGNWNVPITPKVVKPTVEKKVYDNPTMST